MSLILDKESCVVFFVYLKFTRSVTMGTLTIVAKLSMVVMQFQIRWLVSGFYYILNSVD